MAADIVLGWNNRANKNNIVVKNRYLTVCDVIFNISIHYLTKLTIDQSSFIGMIINTHTKYIASGDTVKYIFSYFVLLFRIMIKYLYEFAASRNCGQSSPSLDFGFG